MWSNVASLARVDRGAHVRPAERRAGPEPGLDHGGRLPAPTRMTTPVLEVFVARSRRCDIDDVDRCGDVDAVVDPDHAPSVPYAMLSATYASRRGRGRVTAADRSGSDRRASASVERCRPSEPTRLDRSRSTAPLTITTRGPSSAGIRSSRSTAHRRRRHGRPERELTELPVRRVPPRLVALGRKADRVERSRPWAAGGAVAHRHDGAPASGRSGASLSSVLTKSA
jgi:hypothetical protein